MLLLVLSLLALQHQTCIYLIYQAKGQMTVLLNRESFSEYEQNHQLSILQKENLNLIPKIKKFSVDSLAYKSSSNYTTIFDQNGQTLIWVITASEPYALKAITWNFPIVGTVSYKGFFNKIMALKEYTTLLAKGYDVDLRPVSAWSTLGWFNDPVLSSMLNRSKASFCHLFFHELFHATYYAPSSVNLNENLAEFVAEKATLKFLRNDSIAVKQYLWKLKESRRMDQFLHQKIDFLSTQYLKIHKSANKAILKQKLILSFIDSLSKKMQNDTTRFNYIKQNILHSQNAYFVGFTQYNSLQDSLEEVFNKIYRGKIENLVRDLKVN